MAELEADIQRSSRGAQNMFALENSRTRNSLRSAFENIFEKYGREFAEDDEIDLVNLEVTLAGGHLARIKRMEFGRVFRGKQSNDAAGTISRHQLPSDEENDEFENVFDSYNRRGQKPEDVSRIQSSFVRAVAVRKRKGASSKGRRKLDACELSRPITLTPSTFNRLLTGIIKTEQVSLKRSARLRLHDCDGCFDCILATSIIPNKP